MIAGYLCVILGCLIVVLILKIQELQKRQAEPETFYIDRCGITKNPPENFIEIWQGRTLNIRIDNTHNIIIPHIPAMQAMKWLEAIANEYAVIAGCMELKNEGIEGIKKRIAQWYAYKKLFKHIYYLCKPLGTCGMKKALYKKIMSDFVWTLGVTEEINDFWQLLKKKILLQTKGTTLRQMDGCDISWHDLKLDKRGQRLIEPRYALS